MPTTKSKTQKISTIKSSTKKAQKESGASSIVVEKTVETTPSESSVSVITKSRSPKVIVQSEKVSDSNEETCHHCCNNNQTLIFVYLVVMGIIVLATFFMSLRTYNMVNGFIHLLLQY